MATLLDYILHNKDRDFNVLALNEVDIAAINEIGYLPFEALISTEKMLIKSIDITQLVASGKENSRKSRYNFLITKDRVELLQAICNSERFASLTLSHYINEVNEEFEKQFAAMVFSLDEIGHVQLVFRGTDDSLIGWKEDFKLTYMHEIPAHRSAICYINTYHKAHPNQELVLSGHSKGGNLALYAASFSSETVRRYLKRIYLFDSPGLAKDLLAHPGYQAIRQRLVVIKPQESIVGVMLYCDVPEKIVKSQFYGILQHKTSNWLVHLNGTFETVAKRTSLSHHLESTFKDWTNQLSKHDLKVLCDSFFDTLIAAGITSLNAFSFDDKAFLVLLQAINSLQSIDYQKKKMMASSMQKLIVTYTTYRRREVSEKIQNHLRQFLKPAKNVKPARP